MRKLIATAFIAGVGLAIIAPAQAMPIAPLDQPEVGAVIQVFGGCGSILWRGVWEIIGACSGFRFHGRRVSRDRVQRSEGALKVCARCRRPQTPLAILTCWQQAASPSAPRGGCPQEDSR